jgi:hypothetical protein
MSDRSNDRIDVADVALFVREVMLIGDGADDDQIALKLNAQVLKLRQIGYLRLYGRHTRMGGQVSAGRSVAAPL